MTHLNKSTEKEFITFDDIDKNNKNSQNKFEDFEEVEKKLNEILCKNKGKYSDIPIRLTLHSYYCIDGIIIDLPGLPSKGKIKL